MGLAVPPLRVNDEQYCLKTSVRVPLQLIKDEYGSKGLNRSFGRPEAKLAMLQTFLTAKETDAAQLAIDRPSRDMLLFLARHYGENKDFGTLVRKHT